MTPIPALQVHDLTVGYRGRRAGREVLRGLNLSVRAGELVCLLGPNGIGKSTLLRTVAKMQPALAGRVEVGGVDLQALSQMDLARRLGVVLTDRPVIGALAAQRVVEFGRYPHSGWFGGLGPRDVAAVARALAAVGSSHLAARDFSQLSDGERQRIMIARALAQEPLLLLLDEPTAFLDVPSRVELMGLMRRLARDERLAILLSTHDLELALRTADSIWLVMPDGRVSAGAPEDIVMAGHVARAFESTTIRFHPEERAFRLMTGVRGTVTVRGTGLPAALAAAVLEREGFGIAASSEAQDDRVEFVGAGTETSWRASLSGSSGEGTTFAALADFMRGRPGRRSASMSRGTA